MPDYKLDTPVKRFVKEAWDWAGGVPFAWATYNYQVGEVMRLTAEGFEWHAGDVEAILSLKNERYSIHRCLCEGGVDWLYTIAVKAGNLSACQEFEHYLNRSPIIVDNTNGRQRDRLCVSSEFVWQDVEVRVTSFADDGRAVCVPTFGKRRLHRVSAQAVKEDRRRRKVGQVLSGKAGSCNARHSLFIDADRCAPLRCIGSRSAKAKRSIGEHCGSTKRRWGGPSWQRFGCIKHCRGGQNWHRRAIL